MEGIYQLFWHTTFVICTVKSNAIYQCVKTCVGLSSGERRGVCISTVKPRPTETTDKTAQTAKQDSC